MMAGSCMPSTSRPKAPLVLTEDERVVLERWSRHGRTAQSLALRSKIVLGCADGKTNNDVARQLGTSPQTVCKMGSSLCGQPPGGIGGRVPAGSASQDH